MSKKSLEKRIVRRLERTGFVTGVEIYADSYDYYETLGLMDEDERGDRRVPHISFNIAPAKVKGACKTFSEYLLSRLKSVKPEIVGIGYDIDKKERKIKAYLILNPVTEVYGAEEFVKETLAALNGTLKSYLYDNGIADHMRD